MASTIINLEQIKFEDSLTPLFKGKQLELSSKNFIYARNGSGKSTLSKGIYNQKQSEFEVHVFNGFDSLIGENENLDAFSLAVNASEKEEEIKELKEKITKTEQDLSLVKKLLVEKNGENEEPTLYDECLEKSRVFNEQDRKIQNFYKDSARTISLKTDPVIVDNPRSYNKKIFESEIKSACRLEETDINLYRKILQSVPKEIARISEKKINFENYIKAVNEIISSKVVERVLIDRLDNQRKINFAKEGLEIHKEENICSFCGNELSDEVLIELERYFSADEVKELQNRIKVGKEKITYLLNEIAANDKISTDDFFPDLKDEVEKESEKVNESLAEQKSYLEILLKTLEQKESNLFVESEKLELFVPNNVNYAEINRLIEIHNKNVLDIKNKQKEARDAIRYHEIKLLLENFQYDVQIERLTVLKSEKEEKELVYSQKEDKKKELEQNLAEYRSQVDKLKPKAEKEAIERINKKLRLKVSWELDHVDDDNLGYYRIKEGERYRSVKQLSTGEKNVIAFLYFIERLEEVKEGSRKKKIIVFDDPMSSNDDKMQYLIIWELQRLYQGKDRDKFNEDRDIMVILTHNIHFYLNVQPHGNFKDKKDRTKYDKNNFYRIDHHEFIKILSEKDDFKTNYEAMWVELKDLYECGHKLSMLNTIRRIIETFLKFNALNQEIFYKDNEQYLKLFNVNSHGIDDTTAVQYTETIDEMRALFYQIFKDNHYEEHFKHYWKFDAEK
ncbi:AAA family ATPase [Streptococcus gordonii]|uniref:AAA family ATPase n=1 Tax=Streptococcus gordonii TaxID=1302 RepID=UPI001EDEFBCF|nr:AAA family ATPase [Streptococcus gordonii]MCG4821752.1 AAA family ATPase [Streptococcus gordonii]MCG4847110.1 AAA family ATPase [Streptococcus gordonii]MDE8686528.1 AAA family ATPase [Streptococcus gordonii]